MIISAWLPEGYLKIECPDALSEGSLEDAKAYMGLCVRMLDRNSAALAKSSTDAATSIKQKEGPEKGAE